jgi:hypothetical protein
MLVSGLSVGMMIFYHFIPFLIVGGAPDSLANIRPLLVAGSVLLVAFGIVQSWRQKRARIPASRLSVSMLWTSVLVVFSMIAFSQAIANALASALGD